MFGIIFYNFKDSNSTINVVTNIATLDAIYILPNIIQTNNITARKANVATTEKNVVTTNWKAKNKEKEYERLRKVYVV